MFNDKIFTFFRMKRKSFYELNCNYESKRLKKCRDDLLLDMKNWCILNKIVLSDKVKFGAGCAGHGLIATASIATGEELAKIPRSATLHHSHRFQLGFKA